MPGIKIAIIGAGPAGISAAVYLKRAGFDIQLFEKGQIGGLLNNAHKVENYPGFPDGISGIDLIANFKAQLDNWHIDITQTKVRSISQTGELYNIETKGKPEVAHAVILATGTRAKNIGLKGETALAGKLLFYEITKVPYPKLGARVIIIGGGDCAFDYALNLAEQGAKVDILMRGDKPRCLPLLEERAEMSENIWLRAEQDISGFEEEDGKLVVNAGGVGVFADFGLIAVGREPGPLAKLSGKGIFPAGDVIDPHFRQVGIAVGSGLKAAMSAEKYLAELKSNHKNISGGI